MKNLIIAAVAVAVSWAAGQAPGPQKNPDARFHRAPKPLPAGAVAGDWISFMGPTRNMFSPETKLLRDFSKTVPPIVWEMKKGESYASPAVSDDRLVLFHRLQNEEVVDCLNAMDGRRYWRFRYPTNYRDRFGWSNGPRSSPVIAAGASGGDAAVTLGAEGMLHCLNLKTGEVRWKRDLAKDFKLKSNFFGVGTTPLVEGDKVIVNVGAPGGPSVVAFDIRKGSVVWSAGKQWGQSYASPVSAAVHGKRRVFVFAGGESRPPAGGLMCLDPASGKVEGTFPWRGDRYESVNASSPLVIGNRVFVSESYGSGGAMVEVTPQGGLKKVWTNPDFGMHFMNPIPKDGYLYGVDGHGPQNAFFVCVDMKTGKEVWREQPTWEETVTYEGERRRITIGTFRCSLLMVDGRCLCLGEFGHLLWLDLNPKGFKELSRTWLFAAQDTWTPPVLSRGLLYVCQNNPNQYTGAPPRIVCYDLRGS